jgi:hypothetical protein
MPKPNIGELTPWDVSNINRALASTLSLDKRSLKELQEKRQYAFRNGNKEYEENIAKTIQRLLKTTMRTEQLLKVFTAPTIEELSFNEWE